MKKVILGFDLDDVLNNSYIDGFDKYIRMYAKENNIDLKVINEAGFNIQSKYNLSKFHSREFINKYQEKIDANIPFRKEVKGIFEKLKNDKDINYIIYIITSRVDKYYNDCNAYEVTKLLLERYEIPYDKLIVNATEKGKICKENNVDFFIDDRAKYCLDVNSNNITTFVFDTYYNRNLNEPNIERIYSLEEYYNRIIELTKKKGE